MMTSQGFPGLQRATGARAAPTDTTGDPTLGTGGPTTRPAIGIIEG